MIETNARQWVNQNVRIEDGDALIAWGSGEIVVEGVEKKSQLYNDIGGFKPMPLLEDVDISRRLGRRRIAMLRTAAVTSAERYRRDGYVRRIARNWLCLTLYYCRVPVRHINRLYS